MQNARGTRRTASRRRVRALAGTLVAVLLLCAGCGLNGALTLPEKPSNVVIRPGPGGQQPPAGTPSEPQPEPLPPPELPPDTRGNTRG